MIEIIKHGRKPPTIDQNVKYFECPECRCRFKCDREYAISTQTDCDRLTNDADHLYLCWDAFVRCPECGVAADRLIMRGGT